MAAELHQPELISVRHITAVSALLPSQRQLSRVEQNRVRSVGKQHFGHTSHLRVAPPAASRPSHDAAPTLVQLGVMSVDVVPYIPQSKESLTAELHPESTHSLS